MSQQTPDHDEVTAEQSVQDADLEAAERFDGAVDAVETDEAAPTDVEDEVYGEADDITTEAPADDADAAKIDEAPAAAEPVDPRL